MAVTQFSSHKILLVDYDKTARIVFTEYLKRIPRNIDIYTVESVKKAIREIREKDFALILMELRFPQLNGFTCAEIIRKQKQGNNQSSVENSILQPENATTKANIIIGFSASCFPYEIENAFKAGMNDFIPKPTTIKDFEECVLYWLTRREKLRL